MASHTSDPFYQLQKLTKELLGSELKSANHDAKLTFGQTTRSYLNSKNRRAKRNTLIPSAEIL